MANVTAGQSIKRIAPDQSIVLLNVSGTGTKADTIVITLGSHGIKTLHGVIETIHTTADSVIIPVLPRGDDYSTTSVSSGVLTITVGTRVAKKHNYLLIGE